MMEYSEKRATTPLKFEFRSNKAVAAITFLSLEKVPDLTKGRIDKLIFFGRQVALCKIWETDHPAGCQEI
jgi:hypothetical protein